MFWKANEVYLAAMPACFAFALNENSNVNPYSWAFLFKNCSPPNTSFEVYQKNISATSCCDVFNIQQLKIPASFLTSWLHLENLWSFIHNIEQTPHIFNLTDPSEAIYQLSAPPQKMKTKQVVMGWSAPLPSPCMITKSLNLLKKDCSFSLERSISTGHTKTNLATCAALVSSLQHPVLVHDIDDLVASHFGKRLCQGIFTSSEWCTMETFILIFSFVLRWVSVLNFFFSVCQLPLKIF